MKTVAVTGAEGFIGSHLVEELLRKGYRVRAMVQYNAFTSSGWLEVVPSDIVDHLDVVYGDVRDRRSVMDLIENADAVCHLAALISVPHSYDAPDSYLATNTGGTVNVMEAARSHGTPRVIHTSSSEVYGSAVDVPMNESHPLQAQSPYAASKIAADKFVESYHLSFGLPVTTLRPFNSYGPRQSARALIPSVMSQVAAGRRQVRVGSLAPRRDFTFVDDIVAAYISVLEADSDVIGEVLNIGSGREISVEELVILIAELMGRDVEAVVDPRRVRPARSDVMRLMCDFSKAKALTSWKPAFTLDEGLALTGAWFSDPANRSRYCVDRYCT
jgi:UDP-glucose 4-epimerase